MVRRRRCRATVHGVLRAIRIDIRERISVCRKSMRSGTHLAVQLLELGVVLVHLKVELGAGD